MRAGRKLRDVTKRDLPFKASRARLGPTLGKICSAGNEPSRAYLPSSYVCELPTWDRWRREV